MSTILYIRQEDGFDISCADVQTTGFGRVDGAYYLPMNCDVMRLMYDSFSPRC